LNTAPTIEAARGKNSQLISWLVFAGLVCVTVALFLFPAIIIQPFRFQSPRWLIRAIAVRQQAPFWTGLTAAGASLAALLLWWRISRWKKAALITGLCCAFTAAVMARVDYFELMFHPVPAAGFDSAGSSKVEASEMVMAVNFNGDARAYPIFEMAYHHVLNDVVGGVPIAVTY
jgi:hypothetical protein